MIVGFAEEPKSIDKIAYDKDRYHQQSCYTDEQEELYYGVKAVFFCYWSKGSFDAIKNCTVEG